MRILVCGGRDFTDWKFVHKWLYDYCTKNFNWPTAYPEIISGMARGVDTIAANWARDNWIPVHEFPADWKTHGKAAGFIRNQQMLDEGKPDLVVAFPGGAGTADMIHRAKKAGVRVIEVKYDTI